MNKEYQLTQTEIDTFKLRQFATPTAVYLPTEKQIPTEFWQGNIYTKIAESIMFGEDSPPGEVSFNEGYDSSPEGIASMQKCILSHLRSTYAEHDHKIAAVGFMLSKIVTIKE